MASEVLDFLTKLATEPETLSAFYRDSKAVMEKDGLDEKVQAALVSGDPLTIHRSIAGCAGPEEEALEASQARAKMVMDVLATDPAVAQWLQSYYYQSLLMLQAAASGYATQASWHPTPQQTAGVAPSPATAASSNGAGSNDRST